MLGQKKEYKKMYIKPQDHWADLTVEDFGLKSSDQDAHCPAFFIIRKALDLKRKDLHIRSEVGKKKDKQKSARKKKAKRQRRAQEAACASAAASSSAAPAPPASSTSSTSSEGEASAYEVDV